MEKKLAQIIRRKIEAWMGIKLSLRRTHQKIRHTHRKASHVEEKKFAKLQIAKRLSEISEAHDIQYNRFRLSSAKTRWGSCSRKRNINLNWKLIFAPPGILDYVIMHELTHLTHMNHSRAFWAHLEKLMPQYKTPRAWLKQNGRILSRTTSQLFTQ